MGKTLWDSEKSQVYVKGCTWELGAEDGVVKN